MIHNVYSVFDCKAGAYLQPFFSVSDAACVRAISDLLSDDKHMFARHSEDYTLFRMCSFEDCDGRFELLDHPEVIANLATLKSVVGESQGNMFPDDDDHVNASPVDVDSRIQ